jgi:NADH-quinone oxidoreductase subunit N
MNLGAFGVVIYLANATGTEELDDLRGMGWKAPWVCGALVVFLLSLTGVPPTAGFIGKYYLMVATRGPPTPG